MNIRLESKLGLGLNTKLLAKRLQLSEVLFVLLLVLNLILDTFEDTDRGRIVVDTASSLQCGFDDSNRGNQIVGKAVVKTALQLEQIIDTIKELDIAFRE